MKKRSNIKNLLSFLLAVMLIFSTLLSFSSCADVESDRVVETTTILRNFHNHPNIPATDYEGYNFTFLTDNSQPNKGFIVAESENGEVMSDAITKRNTVMNQKYNVVIAHKRVNDVVSEVKNAVNSGVIDFDAILAKGSDLSPLAISGMLCDLNTTDLTLDGRYTNEFFYDQNANEQLAFGDKLYFTNCIFNTHSFGYVMFFNKYLIDKYNLTNPYEMIQNNTWTIDNWAEMVKNVNKDLDYDEEMTAADRYGYLYSYSDSKIVYYASGIRASSNNENGNMVSTLLDDKIKLESIYTKLYNLYSNSEYTIQKDYVNENAPKTNKKQFYDNYLFTCDYYLFTCADATMALELWEMEHEFGILPIPKLDSEQKEYMTLYPEDGYLFALPSLIPDPDRTVTIVEDMNYYSTFLIKPIWDDVLLVRRYARDNESEGILRDLYDNRVYDIGLYCDIGGIRSDIVDAVYTPTNSNISRRYEIFKKRIQDEIDLFNNNFRN